MSRLNLWLLVALVCVSSSLAFAENWPRFRGPSGVGVSAEKGLPQTWDGKSGDNVLWKSPIGKKLTGWSSPIVWEDRVFLTCSERPTKEQETAKQNGDHFVVCYQASDGKEVWRTKIEPGKELAGNDTAAAPTPVTDGKSVFAWFGSGVIAAIDFEGKVLWRKERSGPFHLNPGICSSPAEFGENVILLSDQNRDAGFLQGLNKKTGDITWEHKRVKTGACNASPFVLDVNGKPQLIVSGERILQGLRPQDGEPIWWCKSLAFGASPAYGRGVLFIDKGSNEPAQAVDPTGAGDVTETHVKWKIERVAGEYSSPVISGNYIYRLQGDGVVSIYSLEDGEKLSTGRLEGISKIVSPIVSGDGLVYYITAGTSYVIKPSDSLEIVATNKLGGHGSNSSSPAISGGKIFVRDFENLYCIGKK